MSVKIKISPNDKRKMESDFKKFSKKIGLSVEDSVAAVALEVSNEAKKRVAVDNGRLRASIIPIKKSRFTWEVATQVGYGLYVEYGTGPHEIRVKTKKALSNGKVIFGKKVLHPGTRAQPFLRPAFASVKRRMFQTLKKNYKKI